jgi:hypothetical protein
VPHDKHGYAVEQSGNPFDRVHYIPLSGRYAVEGTVYADFPTLAMAYRDNQNPKQTKKDKQK